MLLIYLLCPPFSLQALWGRQSTLISIPYPGKHSSRGCDALQADRVREEQRLGATPMDTAEAPIRQAGGAEKMDVDAPQSTRCIDPACSKVVSLL